MKYVIVCILTIILEFGILLFFNRKEPTFKLDCKKYGGIITIGNMLLMVLAVVLQAKEWHPAIWYFGLCSYLFCLCIYDIKFRELPDWFHLILLLFYGYLYITKQLPYTVTNGLLTALVVGLFLVIVFLIRKDAIGLGDIKAMIVCALYAGVMVSSILIRAMVTAFLCSVVLLLLKKVNTKSGLPFIPFVFLGALFM